MTIPLDDIASARAGEPLEQLSSLLGERFAPAPPWTLGDAALRFLWESRSRGLQNGRKRRSPEAVELRDAGLLNGFGAPTPEALEVLGTMGAPTATLIATLTGGGHVQKWSCWFRGATAVVDEGTSGAGGAHGVALVEPPVAVARLLDWLGVAPAWSFGDAAPQRVPDDLLDARCESVAIPVPADAGPSLRHAWSSGAWRRVLVADGASNGLVAFRTEHGWWRATPHEDATSELEPLPSAALVARLLALAPLGAHR